MPSPPAETVCYAWERRAGDVILTFFALLNPATPGWLRVTALRDLARHLVLRADADGIGGNSSGTGPVPWDGISHLVLWQHRGLTLVGVVRRDHGPGKPSRFRDRRGNPTWGTSVWPRYTRYALRAGRQIPGRGPAPVPVDRGLMAPDGMPLGTRDLLTASGWTVSEQSLIAATRRFAPQVTVTDLTRTVWVPQGGAPDGFEALGGALKAIGRPWRRLLRAGRPEWSPLDRRPGAERARRYAFRGYVFAWSPRRAWAVLGRPGDGRHARPRSF